MAQFTTEVKTFDIFKICLRFYTRCVTTIDETKNVLKNVAMHVQIVSFSGNKNFFFNTFQTPP